MANSRGNNENYGAAMLEPGEKPTLKTISRLSGLAVATVSRALNDAPDIRTETKNLVRRIASEIGYVPNRAGVRLRTGRTNVISLVLATEQNMMNNTARLFSSIAAALRNTPFHLIITPSFPDQDPMEPVRYIVENRSADAIIMNQTRDRDPRVEYLIQRNFPFATHGRTDFGVEHPYFDYDNHAFGNIGLTKLVRRGCKKVLIIAPPKEHLYAEHLMAGASEAAQAHGVDLVVADDVNGDSHHRFVRTCIAERLSHDDTIDGMLVASTNAAIAACAGAEDAGRVLGTDMEICAKEAISLLEQFRPNFIVMRENVHLAGEFLARAAIQAIQHPELPPMQKLEVPQDDGT